MNAYDTSWLFKKTADYRTGIQKVEHNLRMGEHKPSNKTEGYSLYTATDLENNIAGRSWVQGGTNQLQHVGVVAVRNPWSIIKHISIHLP